MSDLPETAHEPLPPDDKAFRKHAGGRPTKLTEEWLEKMLTYIRAGAYIETAAIAAGTSKAGFYGWMKEANAVKRRIDAAASEDPPRKEPLKKRDKLLLKFLDSLEKAAAEGELADVLKIAKAGATNWQASAWRLERKHPDRWGRRDFVKTENSGPNGGPIPVVTANLPLTEEAQQEILRRHFARMNPNPKEPEGTITDGDLQHAAPAAPAPA